MGRHPLSQTIWFMRVCSHKSLWISTEVDILACSNISYKHARVI